DNGRGFWSWGAGLTVGDVTRDIYVLSSSNVLVIDPDVPFAQVTQYPFTINTAQNAENTIRYRSWNGVVTVYVNGAVAATVKGLWDEPGLLSIATNYPGSALAQGFMLRSTSVTVQSAKLLRNEQFDNQVTSELETIQFIDSTEFEQLSLTLENPFSVSRESLDFGFRVGLPVFERELEIKRADSSNESTTFFLKLTHTPTGTVTWQNSIPLPNHSGHLYDIELREVGGITELVIDDIVYRLTGLSIDFGQEHFEDVEFFVNSDLRKIESDDARFLSSPYVRVTNFGLWND
ncbi:MAG: hypothetical protein V3T49_00130, partial [Dehalococcoidia bacterium]